MSPHRWGIVLAGGDGVRLNPLTQLICGESRPKQFCPILDRESLLAHTLRRVNKSLPREQVLVSLSGPQCKWYLKESALVPEQRIVQPSNRGTAPPIAHSLLSIAQADEDAVVAVFPSDHHYSDETLFTTELESAFAGATEHTDAVVLLGARPHFPAVGFGWIDLGPAVEDRSSGASGKKHELFHVAGFHEKPSAGVAERLLHMGSLWNTFVMVGRVKAFLEMLQAALPDLMASLRSARLWAGTETHIEYGLYQRIRPADFSHQVLAAEPNRLLVMQLGEVGWSDLGDPERVLETAAAAGQEPVWAQAWKKSAIKAQSAAIKTPFRAASA